MYMILFCFWSTIAMPMHAYLIYERGRLAREGGVGISVGRPLETVRFFFSVRVYCDDVIPIYEYSPQLVFHYNAPKS